MHSYKILEHTADVRLYVEGSSMEDIFTAAIEGMAEIIKKNACKVFAAKAASAVKKAQTSNAGIKKEIKVSSANPTLLLIDFLSEVLTLSQIEKIVFCAAKFGEPAGKKVSAIIYGRKVKSFDEDIKAVTYHEAEIKKNKSGNLETIIIFDI